MLEISGDLNKDCFTNFIVSGLDGLQLTASYDVSNDECAIDDLNDEDQDGICSNFDICLNGNDNIDSDLDGIPDDCDDCSLDSDNDIDLDGICGNVDNCIYDFNPEQADNDDDLEGDACDADDDNDGCLDGEDDDPYSRYNNNRDMYDPSFWEGFDDEEEP